MEPSAELIYVWLALAAAAAAAIALSLQLRASLRKRHERDRLFTLSQDLLCVLELDGTVVHGNPAFERYFPERGRRSGLLGAPARALADADGDNVSARFFGAIHADDLAAVRRAWDLHFDEVPTIEFRVRVGADWRWLSWSMRRDRLRHRRPRLYAVAHDITGRKHAEQTLASETTFRRAMEDSIWTGMRAIDNEGRIIYVNPALCRMTGFDEHELIGSMPPYAYWAPEDYSRNTEQIERVLAGAVEPDSGVQTRIRRRDGHIIEATMHVSPLIDVSGRQSGWMASLTDITESNRIRIELAEAHERFTTVMDELGAAVSVAPLSSLPQDPAADGGLSDRTLSDRTPGGRMLGDRALGGRLQGDRTLGGRTLGDRTLGDRIRADRPATERLFADRPLADRLAADRPLADRPFTDRPLSDRLVTDRLLADRVLAEHLPFDHDPAQLQHSSVDSPQGAVTNFGANGYETTDDGPPAELETGLGNKPLLFANHQYRALFGASSRGHCDLLASAPPGQDWTAQEVFVASAERWFEVRSRRILWVDGRPVRLVVAHDVTTSRHARELQEQQIEQLQQTSRLVTMGEMASSIAHELNQPLSAISNYALGLTARLKRDAGGAAATGITSEIIETFDKTARQAQRAAAVIRRIRTFVKRSEPERRQVTISAIVADAVGLAEIAAKRSRIRIRTTIAPDLPDLHADPILIEQVLINLLTNAIHASRDQPRSEVALSVTAADGQIAIAVSDQGPGLPPDVQGRLFEPFFTTKADGMGIGLNICRSIIESHGGRLWLDATTRRGCTFRFVLPTTSQTYVSSDAGTGSTLANIGNVFR